jgi:single-strand DNA-binding protein
MFNRTTLIGRVEGHPDLRYTAKAHKPVTEIRVATTRVFNGRDGQPREDTQWHRVVVWGKEAEACKERLAEGDLVFVEGRIQMRRWTDHDGNKRYTTEIVSEKILFLGDRPTAAMGAGENDQPDHPRGETALS